MKSESQPKGLACYLYSTFFVLLLTAFLLVTWQQGLACLGWVFSDWSINKITCKSVKYTRFARLLNTQTLVPIPILTDKQKFCVQKIAPSISIWTFYFAKLHKSIQNHVCDVMQENFGTAILIITAHEFLRMRDPQTVRLIKSDHFLSNNVIKLLS